MLTTTPAKRCLALVIVTAGIVLAGCESTHPTSPSTQRGAVASDATPASSVNSASVELTLVTDPSQVCMVNNQFMGQPQIPVQVEGRTYYGCCAMCKGRLESDASARMASDPVSHTPVDKATAVIGRLPNGSTLYFASREHFDSYSRRAHAP